MTVYMVVIARLLVREAVAISFFMKDPLTVIASPPKAGVAISFFTHLVIASLLRSRRRGNLL
jgi:hypothetical protein